MKQYYQNKNLKIGLLIATISLFTFVSQVFAASWSGYSNQTSMTANHSTSFSGNSAYKSMNASSTASSPHPQNLVDGLGISIFLYDKCNQTGWRQYHYSHGSSNYTTSYSRLAGGFYGTCANHGGGHLYQDKSYHAYSYAATGLSHQQWLCSGSQC